MSQLVAKFDDLKKDHKFDLSKDEDLSLALMNLISIEEHLFFTAEKTGKDNYFDLLSEVREIRKSLMKKMIKDYEGEVWCISKHLLASSMRLMEVGTKEQGHGKKKEAKEMFDKAFNLYSLFWALNFGLVDTKNIEKIDEKSLNNSDDSKKGVLSSFKNIVKKVVDCCIE